MTKIKICGLTRMCDIEAVNLIKPEYIAFANRLLHDCGINIPQNWHYLMDKMFETAGDKDIKEI